MNLHYMKRYETHLSTLPHHVQSAYNAMSFYDCYLTAERWCEGRDYQSDREAGKAESYGDNL